MQLMSIIAACTIHGVPEVAEAAFGALTRTVTHATSLAPVALQVMLILRRMLFFFFPLI
jgi:hypothetical protein